VASHLEAAGESETARLLRALQPVLADTTHEVFRADTPAERENRLLPANANYGPPVLHNERLRDPAPAGTAGKRPKPHREDDAIARGHFAKRAVSCARSSVMVATAAAAHKTALPPASSLVSQVNPFRM